jgi:hypothetical protein
MTIGDDFTYVRADLNFNLVDKFRDCLYKSTKQFKLIYSTVTEYLEALKQELSSRQISLPVYHGDFFPYAGEAEQYWTGFYTSRPNLKQYIRHLSNVAISSSNLYSFGMLNNPSRTDLY